MSSSDSPPLHAPSACESSLAVSGLSAAQIASFERDGFLLLPGFYTAEAMLQLSTAIESMIAGWSGSAAGGVFTTDEQARKDDAYFLGSGDAIRPFLEASAAGAAPSAANLNKVGHALHELAPAFHAATMTPAVAAVCRSLGYAAPAVVQSMFIFKAARAGAAVAPHVDGAFLRTTPQSVLGFWVPLERCHLANGCLWAVPGSHRARGGKCRRVFRRAQGGGTEFSPPEPEEFDRAGAVALEVPAGTLVLLHHALVHWSEANASEESRHAYTWHVLETGKGSAYPAENWLQRSDGGPFPCRLY